MALAEQSTAQWFPLIFSVLLPPYQVWAFWREPLLAKIRRSCPSLCGCCFPGWSSSLFASKHTFQLGTSRHTPFHHPFSSLDFRILRRKAVFFSGHICKMNICIALLFPSTWTLQSLYFWASWRILIFLLGPLRVFSLPPTPLLPDPEYQQIKLF